MKWKEILFVNILYILQMIEENMDQYFQMIFIIFKKDVLNLIIILIDSFMKQTKEDGKKIDD